MDEKLSNSILDCTGPRQRLECHPSTIDSSINEFTSELALRVLQLQSRATKLMDRDATVEDWMALLHDIENLDGLKASLSDHLPAYYDTSGYKLLILRPTTRLLWERFTKSGKQEDLDVSIKFEASSLQITPDDHADKPECLSRLGASYQYRFEWLKDVEDLSRAVRFREQAVTNTPFGHLDKPRRLDDLGISYHSSFESLGGLRDLKMSVSYMEQAVMLTPGNHPDKFRRLNSLGSLCRSLFERLDRLSDIHQSLNCIKQAIELAPDGYPDKPAWLNNLGTSYCSLFKRFGIPDDLDKLVSCNEEAIVLTPNSHPERPARLNNLSTSYQYRFESQDRLDDLEKSVCCNEEAVTLTPSSHPNMPARLNILGTSYQSRFNRLGRLDDLNKAITSKEQAVLLTLDGHSEKPARLSNLGTSYHSQFKRLGRLDDLDKSISCKEQAVMLTPDGHPEKPARLSNLGTSYHSLFKRIGRVDDLDKSTSCKEQAVMLTPDGHPEKSAWLDNLGTSYHSQFEYLGRLDDLQKSISFKEQAVLLTPDGHPEKLARLSNLGTSYHSLFEHLGRLDDLEKSINCKEQAVMLTPDGHPEKLARLSNLGTSYHSLFEHLGRLDVLKKSINCKEQAVMLTPDGHPEKPAWLSNLGTSYHSLFKHLGRVDDLDGSTSCQEQAVLLTPDGHPHNTIYLNSLGDSYWRMFMHSPHPDHSLNAINSYKCAAIVSTGLPTLRLQSSHCWAKLSRRIDLPSLEAYAYCMSLLPQVVRLGTSAAQLYDHIARQRVGDLVTEAAAVAISMQQLDLAVEWLEQGRSLFWSQTLQFRLPYNELYAVVPEMAQELESVSYQLESAPTLQPDMPSTHDGISSHAAAWARRRLLARREELLESARLLPGLEDFLCPLKVSKLMGLIHDGAAVIVNVHDDRCDALVMQASTQIVTCVPLVGFSVEKAETARYELSTCVVGYGRGFKKGDIGTRPNVKNALAMLWYDVVKPVLDHLGIMRVLPADDLPHITWCATGPLSFLPLHAAGDYSNPSTVLPNLAISSYVPKISLLSQRTSSPSEFSGILAVGHGSFIRNLVPLPGVKTELDEVQLQAKFLPFTRLDEESACTGAVLRAMADHSWVHFACHGSQNSLDPMKSALHLHDGDLDLTTISRNSFKNAEFAFLSACQTATGDSSLPDESLHLAAGLLVAGYRSVIASMWSFNDPDALHVTAKVYECLLEGGIPDSRKAAKALHKAVGSLRDTIGVDEFARWVPHVHFGR